MNEIKAKRSPMDPVRTVIYYTSHPKQLKVGKTDGSGGDSIVFFLQRSLTSEQLKHANEKDRDKAVSTHKAIEEFMQDCFANKEAVYRFLRENAAKTEDPRI